MKPLTRDITVTLVVKLSLLILLWVVCFRGVEKPARDTRRWLLGSGFSETVPSETPVTMFVKQVR